MAKRYTYDKTKLDDGSVEELYRIRVVSMPYLSILIELHNKYYEEDYPHIYIGALIIDGMIIHRWSEDSLEDLAIDAEKLLSTICREIQTTIGT